MEKQLLFLLDYELRVNEPELLGVLSVFLLGHQLSTLNRVRTRPSHITPPKRTSPSVDDPQMPLTPTSPTPPSRRRMPAPHSTTIVENGTDDFSKAKRQEVAAKLSTRTRAAASAAFAALSSSLSSRMLHAPPALVRSSTSYSSSSCSTNRSLTDGSESESSESEFIDSPGFERKVSDTESWL